MTTQYYSRPVSEEEQLRWQTDLRNSVSDDEEDDDDENEDDEFMIDDGSSMSSSPSIPDENINFDLVYALHTFVATVEGQASVVKGDALVLMEDTNIYWWLVEVLTTREVGYIPAENIETPYERLARLNKHRNVEITSPSIRDTIKTSVSGTHPLHPSRKVTIGDESMSKIFHYEIESEFDEDEEYRYEHTEYEDENYQDSNNNEFDEVTMHSSSNQNYTKKDWQETTWDFDDEDNTEQATKEEISLQEELVEENVDQTDSDSDSSSEEDNDEDKETSIDLRVFAGNIGQGPLFHSFPINVTTTTEELIKTATEKFRIMNAESSENTTIEYYIAVQGTDGDEYVLSGQDKPFSIFKTLTNSLTTPMPSLNTLHRYSQQSLSSIQSRSSTSRRPRSSSFSNYEQTIYDEDYVIRFYLHRRIKRAREREGLIYIKVSLYPDDTITNDNGATVVHKLTLDTAFTKNATPIKSKKPKQRMSSRSEIDRIDKIIAVKQEYHIGQVINLALEKFHIPDSEADNFPGNNDNQRDSRQLAKYKMSVRGNSQEVELNPHELMSNVLLKQKSSSPNHIGPITSDILFILHRVGSVVKQTQKERHSSKGLQLHISPIDHYRQSRLYGTEERRPSILDILMDNSPRPSDRRPSVIESILEPSSSRLLLENNHRRPSGTSIQERKSSLNSQLQPQSPSSSFSFPTPKSPNSILGFSRRTSNQSPTVSTFDERINSDSTILLDHNNNSSLIVTPTSSSSIMRQQPSSSTDRKKEGFRQQFKRLVGWGSSSTRKQTPPPLSTPFSDMTSSGFSFTSAPSSPLPPTPSTPRSILTPTNIRQSGISHPLEINTPTSLTRTEPTAAALAAAAVISASCRRLSTVSSNSSISTISSVTSQELAAVKNQDLESNEEEEMDSDSDDDSEETKEEEDMTKEPTSPTTILTPTATLSSTTTKASTIDSKSIEDRKPTQVWNTDVTILKEPPIPPIKNNMTLPPVIPKPTKSPLRNKSSMSISNSTTINDIPLSATEQEKSTFHPMQEMDDLVLLVAHGVDFLRSKENTKWDEEEGGYTFHPWNKPQSSFTVESPKDKENSNDIIKSPVEEHSPISPPLTPLPIQPQNENETNKQLLEAVQQQRPSLDDEELQRIVAAHIVF